MPCKQLTRVPLLPLCRPAIEDADGVGGVATDANGILEENGHGSIAPPSSKSRARHPSGADSIRSSLKVRLIAMLLPYEFNSDR